MADRRRTRSLAAFVLISSLLGGCAQAPQTAESTTGRAADGSTGSTSQTETVQTDTESEETDMTEESAAAAGPYTEDTPIDEVRNDPVFEDYGRLLFPVDEGYMSGDTLGTLQLAWYTDIQPAKTVEIVNSLYERAASGEQIFFDIYTDEEKSEDPEKINTGLFFFRGDSGAETAIVNAGGGFAYVGAMQDSFPVALELSKMGYNAFALIYRPGAGTACEDLSRAIAWLSDHAEELGIDMDGYSLWGGSAGARMADWVGTEGTEAFGEEAYPKPAAIVMQYTGLSEVTGDEPPTYANVGTADGIANYQTMQRRIEELQSLGIDAEIEVFEGLGHGFGLGTGTVAEGWVDHAVAFWEEHLPSSDNVNASIRIPDSIEEIPDEYFEPAEEGGTLEDLYYQTWESFSYDEQTTPLTKHAVVYLPPGYQPDKKYNVFYLMHGGWSNETTALGTPDSPGAFKNVLDNAILAGEIGPLIVVCPTYNNTNENGQDSDNFSLALRLTDQYHQELVNDLMPAVEGKYSTWAGGTTPEDFEASRDHRAFGGFSMGSVATWHTFQYCLPYFHYFLPMSCGTSLDDETIESAAEGWDPSDYFVFVMTGTEDFAYSYDVARTEYMASTPYFTEGENFAFLVKEGYIHDGTAASEYTYNGMKAFFPGTGNSDAAE